MLRSLRNRLFRTKVISECLERSLFFSKSVRAFPFDSELRASTAGIAFFSLVIISTWAATYYFLQEVRLYPSRQYATKQQETIEIAEIIITQVALALNFAWSLKNGKQFARAYERLTRVDGVMSRRQSRITYDAGTLIFYDALALGLVFFQTLLEMEHTDFRFERVDLAYAYCINVPYLALHLVSQPVYVLLYLSRAQLAHLRRAASVSSPSPGTAVCLAKLHSRLCSVLSGINSSYSFSVVITTASTFLVVVVNLYYIIVRSKGVEYDMPRLVWYLLPDLLWISYWVLEQWIIVTSCASTITQSKEFNRALFELMIEDETNQLAKNEFETEYRGARYHIYMEKLQLHIAMKREAYFSACGLFPIDYTLIHSMIAAATTYLVILVQFEDMNR